MTYYKISEENINMLKALLSQVKLNNVSYLDMNNIFQKLENLEKVSNQTGANNDNS